MKPTANRLKVKMIEEVKPDVEVVKEEGKDAIPLVMPTVKGNSVIKAEVLMVGPDTKLISVGDTVIFSPYGFDEVTFDGDTFIIIVEDMVLAYDKKE